MKDEQAREPTPESKPSPGKVVLESYKQVLASHFIATLSVISVLTLALILPMVSGNSASILLATILCGTLGAFFSALIRLYSFENLPVALLTSAPASIRSWHLAMYSLVPPLVGAIAAALIYMIFAAKILDGGLLPTFVSKNSAGTGTTDEPCKDFLALLSCWGPQEATDYAKCLIWGFVAGFSERFVPDTILRLVARADDV